MIENVAMRWWKEMAFDTSPLIGPGRGWEVGRGMEEVKARGKRKMV